MSKCPVEVPAAQRIRSPRGATGASTAHSLPSAAKSHPPPYERSFERTGSSPARTPSPGLGHLPAQQIHAILACDFFTAITLDEHDTARLRHHRTRQPHHPHPRCHRPPHRLVIAGFIALVRRLPSSRHGGPSSPPMSPGGQQASRGPRRVVRSRGDRRSRVQAWADTAAVVPKSLEFEGTSRVLPHTSGSEGTGPPLLESYVYKAFAARTGSLK